MARKIVITSGKGGVGKTTICANLGTKLANLGHKVLMIDADIGLNNLDVVMGIENKVVFNLTDVISAKCRAKQALVQDTHHPTLFILPSANLDLKHNITAENIKNVINTLETNFDYILIDCPAGVDTGFHRAVFSADEALIVVTPHISSIRDADKVLMLLSKYNLQNSSIVINKVRGDMLLNGEIISVENIAKLLNTNILGVIPDDDALSITSTSTPYAVGTTGNRAFTLLAENLENGSKKIFDCTYKYRGVIGIIRRNLRRKI